jgi:GTPase-activating protein BEM2
MPIQSSSDIHAVCDVVKTWLRQLPEAAFPTRSYFAAIEAAST